MKRSASDKKTWAVTLTDEHNMSNDDVDELSLENAVTINEVLKKVIDTACQIDLVALNAVLVAKRAGAASAGFHVVALELRSFGHKIEQEMAVLERLIHLNVQHIAALIKLKKNLRLLQSAMDKNQQSSLMLQGVYAGKDRGYQSELAVSLATWNKLGAEIRHALSLCRRGAVLSNNGRIEATYGKSMLEDMQHIVSRIDEIMDEAVNGLKSLNQTLSQ